LSLSPLNLFVFATAKIETPAPSLRKLMWWFNVSWRRWNFYWVIIV
jgi:hypothetical protein